MRYYSGRNTTRQIAAESGRSFDATRQAILRPGPRLSDCVEESLHKEDGPWRTNWTCPRFRRTSWCDVFPLDRAFVRPRDEHAEHLQSHRATFGPSSHRHLPEPAISAQALTHSAV